MRKPRPPSTTCLPAERRIGPLLPMDEHWDFPFRLAGQWPEMCRSRTSASAKGPRLPSTHPILELGSVLVCGGRAIGSRFPDRSGIEAKFDAPGLNGWVELVTSLKEMKANAHASFFSLFRPKTDRNRKMPSWSDANKNVRFSIMGQRWTGH